MENKITLPQLAGYNDIQILASNSKCRIQIIIKTVIKLGYNNPITKIQVVKYTDEKVNTTTCNNLSDAIVEYNKYLIPEPPEEIYTII